MQSSGPMRTPYLTMLAVLQAVVLLSTVLLAPASVIAQDGEPEPPPASEAQADQQPQPDPQAAEEPKKDEAPKADEPKKDEPKADEPKKDEAPKADEPKKAEEKKAEEPKKDQPKAEEKKAEEPKKDEPKAEEKKAEEPKKADEPKKDEPKAEEKKAEEPKKDEPKAEEKKAEEPKKDEPKAEEKKAEEPKAEEPKKDEPKAEEKKAEAPKAEEPKAEEKPAEEPKDEEPKAEEKPAEEPKAEEPKAEEKPAEEPKKDEPKAEEKKAEEPKKDEPKAEEKPAEEPKKDEPKAERVLVILPTELVLTVGDVQAVAAYVCVKDDSPRGQGWDPATDSACDYRKNARWSLSDPDVGSFSKQKGEKTKLSAVAAIEATEVIAVTNELSAKVDLRIQPAAAAKPEKDEPKAEGKKAEKPQKEDGPPPTSDDSVGSPDAAVPVEDAEGQEPAMEGAPMTEESATEDGGTDDEGDAPSDSGSGTEEGQEITQPEGVEADGEPVTQACEADPTSDECLAELLAVAPQADGDATVEPAALGGWSVSDATKDPEGTGTNSPLAFNVRFARTGGIFGLGYASVQVRTVAIGTATAGSSCSTAGVDYVSRGWTSVTTPNWWGSANIPFNVTICGDSRPEPNEWFQVRLRRPTNGTSITRSPATGWIIDDDVRFASIAGTKFDDLNGNGVFDAGEPGINGVSIALSGPSGPLTTTTTNGGTYSFGGLLPGSYTVTETPPLGSQPTAPTSLGVTLTSGQDLGGQDFFNAYDASVAGTKFDDLNGNGVFDAGEPGINGVSIALSGPSGPLTTTTTNGGTYSFGGLLPGSYTVTETPPLGSQPTAPTSLGVTLTSGQDLGGQDFFNAYDASVAGTKFDDLNGNGVFDAGEPGIRWREHRAQRSQWSAHDHHRERRHLQLRRAAARQLHRHRDCLRLGSQPTAPTSLGVTLTSGQDLVARTSSTLRCQRRGHEVRRPQRQRRHRCRRAWPPELARSRSAAAPARSAPPPIPTATTASSSSPLAATPSPRRCPPAGWRPCPSPSARSSSSRASDVVDLDFLNLRAGQRRGHEVRRPQRQRRHRCRRAWPPELGDHAQRRLRPGQHHHRYQRQLPLRAARPWQLHRHRDGALRLGGDPARVHRPVRPPVGQRRRRPRLPQLRAGQRRGHEVRRPQRQRRHRCRRAWPPELGDHAQRRLRPGQHHHRYQRQLPLRAARPWQLHRHRDGALRLGGDPARVHRPVRPPVGQRRRRPRLPQLLSRPASRARSSTTSTATASSMPASLASRTGRSRSAAGSGPVSTTTDTNGNYRFEQLAPGSYTVTETLPAGLGRDPARVHRPLHPPVG